MNCFLRNWGLTPLEAALASRRVLRAPGGVLPLTGLTAPARLLN